MVSPAADQRITIGCHCLNCRSCDRFTSQRSAGRLRAPRVLRHPPVNPLKQVAKLGWCDRHHAFSRRRPEKAAALQPLGIERRTEPIVPIIGGLRPSELSDEALPRAYRSDRRLAASRGEGLPELPRDSRELGRARHVFRVEVCRHGYVRVADAASALARPGIGSSPDFSRCLASAAQASTSAVPAPRRSFGRSLSPAGAGWR